MPARPQISMDSLKDASATSAGMLLVGGAALAAVWAGAGWLAGLGVLVIGNLAVAGVLAWLGSVRRAREEQLRSALRGLVRGEAAPPVAVLESAGLGEEAQLLREVAGSLRLGFERLREITSQIERLGPQIATALAELDGSSEEATLEETAELYANISSSIREINDEVAKLARSNDETSSSILHMSGAIEQVAESSASLQKTVESSSTSLHQLGDNIRRVSESGDTVEQVAEDTASAISQMDRSIQEVVEHVRGASELTEQVSRSADEGSRAVGATIDGIARIRELTLGSKKALEGLAERIDEIGQIANVIGAISDETNLLSLNAAIIAAQAGEHGKAFAVVADQVKTLAQRTTTSTREIERLIQAVQQESGNAVHAMEAGIESVEDGVSRSRGAGEALERIRSSASEASSRVSEIARAADEQARNSRHVAEAARRTSEHVHEISTAMAAQTQASVLLLDNATASVDMCRQVSRATEEQRQTGRDITQNIEAITRLIGAIQTSTRSHQDASAALSENLNQILEKARKRKSSPARIAELLEELRERAVAIAAELEGRPVAQPKPKRAPKLALGG